MGKEKVCNLCGQDTILAKPMRFNFQLWHLFLAVAVVGSGLWAWSLNGIGGLSLVAAWACAVTSVITRHQRETANSATSQPQVPKPLFILDAGLAVLLVYWVCFHFAVK